MFVQIAQQNIDNAGVSSKVNLLVGPASETLPTLASEEPFDIAFVDADKESNLDYFLHAKKLVRPGGIIIVDNVVQDGTVSDLSIQNAKVEGTRKLLKYIQGDKSVDATTSMCTYPCLLLFPQSLVIFTDRSQFPL